MPRQLHDVKCRAVTAKVVHALALVVTPSWCVPRQWITEHLHWPKQAAKPSSSVMTLGGQLTRGSMPNCSRYGLKMRAPPIPSSPAVAPETARIPTATNSTFNGFLSPTLHAIHTVSGPHHNLPYICKRFLVRAICSLWNLSGLWAGEQGASDHPGQTPAIHVPCTLLARRGKE